jgi:hypothetical protein
MTAELGAPANNLLREILRQAPRPLSEWLR